jgi:predicted solute-binding protein
MIRLGRIGYVNMAPVFYRLEAEVEEIVGVPTDLNRRLVAREIDVAPISSIAYARNAAQLRLLPRLCVSSEGAVESIQLISKTPLNRIRTVAVTPESATSVVLTKVLLPDAEQVPLGEDAEAKLLIGDAALRSAFEDPTPHHDLGRLWLERTGLPMVFAVWAAPEPAHPDLAARGALVESVRAGGRGAARLRVRRALRLPAGFLARYFRAALPLARASCGLYAFTRARPRRRRAGRIPAALHLDRQRRGLVPLPRQVRDAP